MKSIAFSKPMVLARREGAKTQTRRAIDSRLAVELRDGDEPSHFASQSDPDFEELANDWLRCPYGAPGERLWVREAFAFSSHYNDVPPRDVPKGALVYYRADGEKQRGRVGRWRPPMFMPKWCARDAIRITGARVERLNAISHDDAIAEGIESNVDDGVTYWGPLGSGHVDPRVAFRHLWESINGGGSWAENPWVWVLTFREDGAP